MLAKNPMLVGASLALLVNALSCASEGSGFFGSTSGDDASTSAGGSGEDPGPPENADQSPVVLAARTPIPVSGGTMLETADGAITIAADPDRDYVWWANVRSADDALRAVHSIALRPGDEPGRLVEDSAGLIHVALRSSGAVATLDLQKGVELRRTPVCPAPRGLAYSSLANTLTVACAGGELVSLDASTGTIYRKLKLDQDLRDVVELGDGALAVSLFRKAEVLLLDAKGVVRSRTLPGVKDDLEPAVAWRMVKLPGVFGVALAHQLATRTTIPAHEPNSYVQADRVSTALTLMTFDATNLDGPPSVVSSTELRGALPVDLAINATGTHLQIAAYGASTVLGYSLTAGVLTGVEEPFLESPATSVVFDAQGHSIAFVREPPGFLIDPGDTAVTVSVPNAERVSDTGHALFHTAPGGGVACASCHPEGRDDGRVWQFEPVGARRTSSLVGGVMQTAPFHWTGDLADLDHVMSEVFTRRMGGAFEDAQHTQALARFLDALKPLPDFKASAPLSAEALHGKVLFEDASVGCAACHSGPHFTNNETADVGTDGAFQVPSLIGVGQRAPYLHDGSARTLLERFGPRGGGDRHGHTSDLSTSDLRDLVSYLETL